MEDEIKRLQAELEKARRSNNIVQSELVEAEIERRQQEQQDVLLTKPKSLFRPSEEEEESLFSFQGEAEEIMKNLNQRSRPSAEEEIMRQIQSQPLRAEEELQRQVKQTRARKESLKKHRLDMIKDFDMDYKTIYKRLCEEFPEFIPVD